MNHSYRITYFDPEERIVTQAFYDTPTKRAKAIAKDYAANLAKKGSFIIEEIEHATR